MEKSLGFFEKKLTKTIKQQDYLEKKYM